MNKWILIAFVWLDGNITADPDITNEKIYNSRSMCEIAQSYYVSEFSGKDPDLIASFTCVSEQDAADGKADNPLTRLVKPTKNK